MEHRVKIKGNEILGSFHNAEKAMEHESDSDTNCFWNSWNSPLKSLTVSPYVTACLSSTVCLIICLSGPILCLLNRARGGVNKDKKKKKLEGLNSLTDGGVLRPYFGSVFTPMCPARILPSQIRQITLAFRESANSEHISPVTFADQLVPTSSSNSFLSSLPVRQENGKGLVISCFFCFCFLFLSVV